MTPEAGLFLEKARRGPTHAEAILTIDLGDEAESATCLTAFHAAQALIYGRTSREAKTHQGVRSQFLHLSKDDPRVPIELRRFLSQAYDLKPVADCGTGPDAIVPLAQAANAITTARRFLDCVMALPVAA